MGEEVITYIDWEEVICTIISFVVAFIGTFFIIRYLNKKEREIKCNSK